MNKKNVKQLVITRLCLLLFKRNYTSFAAIVNKEKKKKRA